jgi:hypothetical protein
MSNPLQVSNNKLKLESPLALYESPIQMELPAKEPNERGIKVFRPNIHKKPDGNPSPVPKL